MKRRLNLDPEARKKYDLEMHRKQDEARRKKKERMVYKEIVTTVISIFETIGWEKIELVMGADEEIIDKVVDRMIEMDKFKIFLGTKKGVKLK